MLVWESISEYSKRTGKSKETIRKMIKSGLLESEYTDGGGKIMIKVEEENPKLLAEIAEIKKMLADLSKHLGVIK